MQNFADNTIDASASDACKTCVAAANGGPNISPCSGPPECVAHQFTPTVMSSPASIQNMICTGLRTSLCDQSSLDIIAEKKDFFACPAPSPPSFACSFDNTVTQDVAAWQAGAPYTGASAACQTCLTAAAATGQAQRESTCWGPPVCAQPAFAGMALSMPPSADVRNMICYGVGIPAGRPGGWGEDTADCDAEALAVIAAKKTFFGCPASGPAVNFPCTFADDVPPYVRRTHSLLAVCACV